MAVEDLFVKSKDFKKLAKELDKLKKNGTKQAIMAAIKRTITHVKSTTSKEIRKDYEIKSSVVGKTMNEGTKKIDSSKLAASIIVRGRPLTLYGNFKVTPQNPPISAVKFGAGSQLVGKKYKVRIRIKKGKSVVIKTNPSAFIAPFSGKLQVSKRDGQKRLPISILRTVSVPQMISNEKVAERISQASGEMLDKRVKHELEYRIKKLKGEIT